jgi:RNA polymerase primary sigma factor
MRQLKITRQTNHNESTALGIYLREVNQVELLTAEEEVELTRRIGEGDRHALEELVKANLRFVITVANQFKNRGFKFISYAVWWIRQSIMQALDENSRVVRLPANKIILKNKIRRTFNLLSHEYFRKPTIDELAEAMGVEPEALEDTMYVLSVNLSMDEPVDDEEENNRYDLILSDDSHGPASGLITESLQKEIERTLSNLSPREANILRRYFGLNGFIAQPLEKIGVDFGLSQRKVRQIKENALEKLKIRTHSNSLLKEYISY